MANDSGSSKTGKQPAAQTTEEPNPMDRLIALEKYMDQLTNHVTRLENENKNQADHIEQLEAQVLEPPAGSTNVSDQGKIKMPKPMTFDGTRSKLKTFLVNMEMHLDENKIKNDRRKIIFVSSCLDGEAAEWMQPILNDYYTSAEDEWDDLTKGVFRSYKNFKTKLTEAFGNIDEVRNAERQLRYLRQTGSAQQLAIKFRQITAPLNYDDDVLIALFENMLKEEVQFELIKLDRPTDLNKFIETAVKIDNKLFEIKRKKQEFQIWRKHGGMPRMNEGRPRGNQQERRDRDGDVIMQLNATLTKEEKEKLVKKKACFNCGIPGHFANKCRKPKKNQGTASQGSRQQIATAIHVVTPDESSTEEISETDDELPERYKKRIQQQAEKQKQLQKEIQQALNEPMDLDNDIEEATRRYKKVEIPGNTERLLREWTTLNEEEIQRALKRKNTQAPVDAHEDAHRMVPRNDQSHEVRRKRAPITMEEPAEAEESSESTDYEDSSLIESFHSQLAFQDGGERAISQPALNREQQEPRLDEQEEARQRIKEMNQPTSGYDCTRSKTNHDNETCKSSRSYNTTWKTEYEIKKAKRQGDDLCTCTPAKAICWEESQYTWKEHIERCEKCHEWTYRNCPIHEYSNKVLATIYEKISNSSGYRLCSGQLGHAPNCICMHYPNLGGCNHIEVHWTTCYDDGCEFHNLSKKINQWFPKIPGIAARSKHMCPRGNPRCRCAYEESRHPTHSDLHKRECRATFCQYHHGGLYVDSLEEHVRAVQSYMDRHQKKHMIATTANRKHRTIVILAELCDLKIRILLDSGATGNHIHPEVVEKLQIKKHETKEWVDIVGIDGNSIMQGYKVKTEPVLLKSGPYATTTSFDVTMISGYDAVLGMPWLQEQNPVIDWITGTVSIDNRILRTKLGEYEEIISLQEGSGKTPPQTKLKENASLNEPEAQKVLQPAIKNETKRKRRTQEQPEKKRERPEERVTTRPKPKEQYEQELKEVLAKLPKKYHGFIELFVKKEYRLPSHAKEYEARIPLKPGFTPPSVKQRHKSRDQLELENKFIREFLAAGYIREGRGPASSSPMFVPKKDGTERMVIDYRALNNGTIDDANKAPHQEQKRDLLQGAKIMTVFDVQWGYYNLRTAEEDIWKTAFLTDMGLFEWVVAPMGLKRLPAEFARYMTHVLMEYLNKFVAVYFDDVIIFSKKSEEHDEHVRLVMTKLMNAGLTLKIKKCEFDTTTVNYLGMVYTPEGLKIQPEKMDSILNWPTPTNIKEIQGFLGASGYVRRYLQNYSEIARPLTELLRKDLEFEWNEQREKAFNGIKELVRNAPILMLHNPDKPHLIRPDASGYALGIVLEQPDDDEKWRPVAFFSRKFTTAERNYDVHDRELLAIVEAFKQWKHYLQGVREETVVKSDHHNLKYFTTTKELVGRQVRWAEYLSKFKFRIEHIKGKENVIADALSRRQDYAIGLEQPKTNILIEDKDGIRYNNKAVLAAAITVNETGFHQRMMQATQKDKTLVTALANKEATRQNGLAVWNGSILVPQTMITEIIKEHHDPPLQGHQGIDRTMEKIQRQYYFPNMRKRIMEYISKCDSCNRNKPINHRPYGKMQLPNIPKEPWENLTVDFVQGLPESKDPITGLRYTEIIVIVDRLTKYVIMKPTPKDLTAEQCAILMLREVFSWTGLPKTIISDRDKLFRSKYWQTITKACGIEHSLSTANHQQTDGPTERMIQTIEQHLRHYLDWNQDNWVEILPLAQFAMNNAKNTSTGEVPHFANLGRYPRMTWTSVSSEGRSNEAILQATHMQRMHNTMSKDIQWAEQKMKRYYDMKREDAPVLKKGERVYLLRRTPGSKTFNIKSKRPSDKFDAVKYGPFRIVKKLENDNYQLQLPIRMRIHPIFHISLLEPTRNPENANDEADDEEYEVEKILDRKQENGQIYYLVRWKGYTPENDSWEPVVNLNCHDKVQEYRETIGLEKKKQQARKSHLRPGRWHRRN